MALVFRRALIGYSPAGVERLLESMEQQHLQLLREGEALLGRIQGVNSRLAELAKLLRECLGEMPGRGSRPEELQKALDRLLLACGAWCDEEVARIRDAARERELSLAMCDEALAAMETGLDALQRRLSEGLCRLVEDARRELVAAGEEWASKCGLGASVFASEGGGSAARGDGAVRSDMPGEDEPAASPRLGGRVLVVDDDPATRSVVRLVMEREGCEVAELGDGRAAIGYIEENPPCDLVIVELMLPFVDGLQIVRKIRATPGWESVPVLVLSSNASEQQVVDLFRAGANEHVAKPFSTLELAARARRLLRGY